MTREMANDHGHEPATPPADLEALQAQWDGACNFDDAWCAYNALMAWAERADEEIKRLRASSVSPTSDGVPRLTKEQAAIIGAYTGTTCGPFGDIHEYAERALGHPVWTHQFASERVAEQLTEAAKADFIALCYEEKADV